MRAILLISVLLLSGYCLADAAPSMPPPAMKVVFHQGGSPYTGPLEATFICFTDAPDDDGIIGERVRDLDCQDGVCRIAGWFYKLNPCYEPEQGSILYDTGSGEVETGVMDLESGGRLISIDVDSGEISQEQMGILDTCCLPLAFLLILPFLAAYRRIH